MDMIGNFTLILNLYNCAGVIGISMFSLCFRIIRIIKNLKGKFDKSLSVGQD